VAKRCSWVMSFLAAGLALATVADASQRSRDVTVEIVDSHGAVFQQVPARRSAGQAREVRAYRAFLEAERDARYRIRITNTSDTRVGVVVAVDGRNIISGARSELEHGEPMYILGPWQTEEFAGWRANLSEVNEFYFTDWKDSYAEAFGDASARGVIAVAVYREKEPKHVISEGARRKQGEPAAASNSASPDQTAPASGAAGNSSAGRAAQAPSPASQSDAGSSDAPPSVRAEARELRKSERSDAVGTGYGDRRTEHATRVAFDSERRASQRLFLKYEWRETLCARRLLNCGDDELNRFWPKDTYGFAPPPG
jgi:hypothetical protein